MTNQAKKVLSDPSARGQLNDLLAKGKSGLVRANGHTYRLSRQAPRARRSAKRVSSSLHIVFR